MRLRVGVCVLVLTWLLPGVAIADAFTFYRPYNGVPALIASEYAETPFEACQFAEGQFYDSVTFPVIDAVTWDSVLSTCTAVLSTGVLATVTVSSGSGSCAADVAYDFGRQICADLPRDEHTYAVLLAAFLWGSFIGGMIVGERVGA